MSEMLLEETDFWMSSIDRKHHAQTIPHVPQSHQHYPRYNVRHRTSHFCFSIPGITGTALDGDEGKSGPLMLQGDHDRIDFRNVTIIPSESNE
jgi:hypothetical protein